jgi:hypothetical protein
VQTIQGKAVVSLTTVRLFRRTCDGLAHAFDAAVLAHVKAIAGAQAGW